MANAFYGRLEAYRAARRSKTEFAAALLRNLYRADPAKVEASGWMAEYALAVLRHLGKPHPGPH